MLSVDIMSDKKVGDICTYVILTDRVTKVCEYLSWFIIYANKTKNITFLRSFPDLKILRFFLCSKPFANKWNLKLTLRLCLITKIINCCMKKTSLFSSRSSHSNSQEMMVLSID